jgi:thioredoxin-like negative regulator of GroEL
MVKAIKFYADWCGPCKMYSKIWNKVESELKEEVEFVEIDVDKDTTGLAAKYKVRSIPMTVVIKEEDEIKVTGLIQEKELKELILN